jgi:hypothetical protein
MIPKEKANEIVNNIHTTLLRNNYLQSYEASKQCALIVLRDTIWGYLNQQPIEVQQYWEEVKREIEQL